MLQSLILFRQFRNSRRMIGWSFVATVLVTLLFVITVSTEINSSTTLHNEEIGSGEVWSNDIPTLTSDEPDFLRSTITSRTISKRETNVFYNGVIDREFFSIFSYLKPIIPQSAVIPLNRQLQRGSGIPQSQYIALWKPRGNSPHWGTIGLNSAGKLDGTFVRDNRIYNLSSPDMQSTPVRLLQYVGSETTNNFRFAWVKAINVDLATVVSEKEPNLCSPRWAPAILREQGYEFLGEANIDERIMYYVDKGSVHSVRNDLYTNNVYLLVKQQCQCSCPISNYY